MEENASKLHILSRYFISNTLIVIASIYGCNHLLFAETQSIGYHHQFNFGFNPYTSPVFGYGLGLPFGTYSMSPTRYPWLLNSIPSTPFADKHGFISKIHAKAFLKKLASSQFLSSSYYGLKDKFNLMKHPEFAFTPYGAGYGYGKHYGSAVVPNNPYKSAYADYYDSSNVLLSRPVKSATLVESAKPNKLPIGGRFPESSITGNLPPANLEPSRSHYLKPLIKAGAIITTAALLGKKVLEGPTRLSPSGMILSDIRP